MMKRLSMMAMIGGLLAAPAAANEPEKVDVVDYGAARLAPRPVDYSAAIFAPRPVVDYALRAIQLRPQDLGPFEEREGPMSNRAKWISRSAMLGIGFWLLWEGGAFANCFDGSRGRDDPFGPVFKATCGDGKETDGYLKLAGFITFGVLGIDVWVNGLDVTMAGVVDATMTPTGVRLSW